MSPKPTREATPHELALFDHLKRLTGRWQGAGTGNFPTIDAFEFEESIRFGQRPGGELILHFEQRTQKLLADGSRKNSHWETGFLKVTEGGQIELLNAQSSGRVEVLRGELEAQTNSGFRLCMHSVVQAHDARMLSSSREITLHGDRLTHQMSMATSDVKKPTLHLESVLSRA